jgi:hypothetical protein
MSAPPAPRTLDATSLSNHCYRCGTRTEPGTHTAPHTPMREMAPAQTQTETTTWNMATQTDAPETHAITMQTTVTTDKRSLLD